MIEILTAAARMNDRKALDTLLAAIPSDHRAKVSATLIPGQSGSDTMYDEATKTCRWIGTDGSTVLCVSLTGISIEEAAIVEAELNPERTVWTMLVN